MATTAELMAELQSYLADGGEGLGTRTAKIDLKSDGVIYIDGDRADGVDRPADCTLTVSKADLEAIRAGTLNGLTALATGRIKLSGDMAIALKLQNLLRRHG